MKILRSVATMNGKFESTSNNYDELNLNRVHSMKPASRTRRVGKAQRAHHLHRGRGGGHASLCPPYAAYGETVIRSRERFDLRRHVGRAGDSVCRVAASEDPDGAVRPGALLVPGGAERLVAGETLYANLSRQHGLRRFGRNRLRPHLRAEKNSSDSQE